MAASKRPTAPLEGPAAVGGPPARSLLQMERTRSTARVQEASQRVPSTSPLTPPSHRVWGDHAGLATPDVASP